MRPSCLFAANNAPSLAAPSTPGVDAESGAQTMSAMVPKSQDLQFLSLTDVTLSKTNSLACPLLSKGLSQHRWSCQENCKVLRKMVFSSVNTGLPLTKGI